MKVLALVMLLCSLPAFAQMVSDPNGGGRLPNCTAVGYLPLCSATGSFYSANAPGAAGQIFKGNGVTSMPGWSDFPDTKYIAAAACSNATAGAGWSLPTSSAAVAACRTGTNIQDGVLSFADAQSAQFSLPLPLDWDSSVALNARIHLSTSDTTTARTIIMQMATACSSMTGATDDTSFNTAQSFGTITTNTTANQSWISTLTSVTTTGCTAGQMLHVKISRTTDTSTPVTNVYGVQLTIPRKIVIQAN